MMTTQGATLDTDRRLQGITDGLVAIVKRDCATCRLVAPVLERLAVTPGVSLTVYTQDDLSFPANPRPRDDTSLELSWHLDVETVPTLIRVRDGAESDRTVGWMRSEWESLTGVRGLGPDLPEFRPGCGSLSVDPDRVDELRARYGTSVLRSRRVEIAEREDDIEAMFTHGWTDGLPVVPPTEERVMRMLEGTSRQPDEIVAIVPPDLVEATVEKVAIAAVMAGCLPEHLPWVLTAVEAACNDEFNMHGVLATTMPAGPVLVCSGPGTRAVGMNAEGNVLGQGNRANLTIGRALQLLVRNVGGGRPGGVDRATHGNPGKLSFCFAERDDSPFGFLAESRGATPGADALTVFPGEGPRCVVDQLSRDPESLASTLAACLRTLHHPKLVFVFDALLVIGPEHGRVFSDAGWDRQRIIDEICARLELDLDELVRGAGGIAEGIPQMSPGGRLSTATGTSAPTGSDSEQSERITINKFRPGGLLLAYAGGGAGLFSTIIGGWANGATGSEPVTREVHY